MPSAPTNALLDWLAAPATSLAGVPLQGAALVLGALAAAFLVLWRMAAGAARRSIAEAELRAEIAADQLSSITRAQAEMSGRMQTMAEVLGSRQADLTRAIAERMDGLTTRVGQSIMTSAGETRHSLAALAERLAVIDRAQGEIRGLAGEVVRLQDILSNKQTRGAFGEGRMQAIVADALPQGAYAFQHTLSNGRRPDCLIHMPNGSPPLAIDAKFPLEAYTALKAAEDDGARAFAAQRLRRDMDAHISAIAQRYLIAGETQDTAFLFIPAESIFAELHEHFDDVVQKAHRQRVVIVSPSLLVLSIQVVQALLRDQRMRAEAGRIQEEVRHLGKDLERLDARVSALRNHFGQAGRDIDQILVSTAKIMRRGERIETIDLPNEEIAAQEPRPQGRPLVATP